MPVKFSPAFTDNPGPLIQLQNQVRAALSLPEDTKVFVSMTETYIRHKDIECTIPVGIPGIKKGFKFDTTRDAIIELFAGVVTATTQGEKYVAQAGGMKEVKALAPAPVAPYDDMQDEEWVQAVAQKLFPGVLHLHQSDAMHQPVLGTGSGSIYKTCFIGPELKVAARIKGNQVSFRVTTNTNVAPQGQALAIFERLGVVNKYDDRLTCHAHMSGPYSSETAGEYRALFGAFYAALRPWITSGFPAIGKLTEGVK